MSTLVIASCGRNAQGEAAKGSAGGSKKASQRRQPRSSQPAFLEKNLQAAREQESSIVSATAEYRSKSRQRGAAIEGVRSANSIRLGMNQ